jgi:hypothetical protein
MLGPYPVNVQDWSFRWQDVILVYKTNKDAAFIDIAIPLAQSPSHKCRRAVQVSGNVELQFKSRNSGRLQLSVLH